MKNLDTSLLGSTNLDESISNTTGSSGGGLDYTALALATAALAGQVIQTRTTPKNETEQVCGVKPLFAGSKKDDWDKCALNYNTSKTYTPPTNTTTSNPTEEKGTNWWIVGGSIVGGLVVLGTIAYFVFRNK